VASRGKLQEAYQEPNKVKGYRYFPQLRAGIQREVEGQHVTEVT
jgi:hypothetical protein